MKCLHPITIRAPEHKGGPCYRAYHYILVPCGKCLACLKRRQQDWCIRILNETDYVEKHGGAAYFISLTYDDEHLPIGDGIPTLVKSDLSAFIKRLRRQLDFHLSMKCRFFGCGEYGDTFDRPHYHLCLFLDKWISASDLRPYILKCWSDGLVLGIHFITPKLSEYVAKYSCKQFGVDYDALGIQPPFGLMSLKPAIGSCFLNDENKRFYHDNFLFHTFDSSHTPFALPRYYRDRIFSRDQLDDYVDNLLERQWSVYDMRQTLGYEHFIMEEFRAVAAFENNFKLKNKKDVKF